MCIQQARGNVGTRSEGIEVEILTQGTTLTPAITPTLALDLTLTLNPTRIPKFRPSASPSLTFTPTVGSIPYRPGTAEDAGASKTGCPAPREGSGYGSRAQHRHTAAQDSGR